MTPEEYRHRVQEILRQHAAPALALEGAEIEVVAVSEGIASIRLSGGCLSCPASVTTILFGLEQELRKHLPDIQFLELVP
jgi:Fe-S cluster biogenesis protein NfuA